MIFFIFCFFFIFFIFFLCAEISRNFLELKTTTQDTMITIITYNFWIIGFNINKLNNLLFILIKKKYELVSLYIFSNNCTNYLSTYSSQSLNSFTTFLEVLVFLTLEVLSQGLTGGRPRFFSLSHFPELVRGLFSLLGDLFFRGVTFVPETMKLFISMSVLAY